MDAADSGIKRSVINRFSWTCVTESLCRLAVNYHLSVSRDVYADLIIIKYHSYRRFLRSRTLQLNLKFSTFVVERNEGEPSKLIKHLIRHCQNQRYVNEFGMLLVAKVRDMLGSIQILHRSFF